MNALPKLLHLALLPLLAVSLHAASTYKVQSGDTLSSIARKTGTSPQKLIADNGIRNPNKLLVGQVLKVNSSGPAQTPSQPTPALKPTAAKATAGNYTVQAGETLYAIARRHKLSVAQLTAMNPGLDPAKLAVGQRLVTNGAALPAKKEVKPQTPSPAPKPVLATTPSPAQPKQAPVAAPTPASAPAIASPRASQVAIAIPSPQPKTEVAAKIAMESPATISSVTVQKEISFAALANKHRTSTKQLNELNGWSLKPTTILAKGSEIYVPGQ